MKDIEIFGKEFDDVVGFKMLDTEDNTVTYTEGGGTPNLETVTKTYTPTASQQTETITPSSGYDGIGEVDVTVDAMPTGTEGIPTATKGTVSNHSVSVTPSVTNSAGYIAGGTHSGTAVSVSASELDSGTKSITANGTDIDVVGYAAVDVSVSGGTPTITGLSATYVQSGTVDIHDELSKLVPDLTVTATISNTLQIDISPDEYTLSGTLSVGTSTITVSYSNLTATFTVTVTDYWDYYWDYSSGTLPPDTTFTTSGTGAYSMTANGLSMTSSSSNSYVYFRLDNFQTTSHGMIEVVGNASNISNGYNNWRVSVSDGTKGAQTCLGGSYFRILNSTTGSSTERLCSASANRDYTIRVNYNTSGTLGSYTIDGCLLRSEYSSSNVQYATATRVWCQTMNGTLLIKQIKYKELT